MYVELTSRVGLIPGETNIGVLRVDDHHVVLIDTGLNDTPVRKALRAIQEQLDSSVIAIVTTHGHADHFGGNAFAVKRTSARVYVPALEEAVLRHPLLQPAFLYGGADPLDSLRGRFLLADPSPVDAVLADGRTTVEGIALDVVELAGHSPNQRGILIDGIFFCADVVFPDAALEKYPIPFLFSLSDHLQALTTAAMVQCQQIVPGHGPTEATADRLVALNRAAIDRVVDCLLEVAVEPQGIDALSAGLFSRMGVTVADDPAYYLLRPTVAAYLSHLTRTGELWHGIEHGVAVWQRR